LVKWSIVLDLIYIIGRLWIMIHTVHIAYDWEIRLVLKRMYDRMLVQLLDLYEMKDCWFSNHFVYMVCLIPV